MDSKTKLDSSNQLENLLLEEITTELSSLGIPYNSFSLHEVIDMMEKKEQNLYINLQPTYAQHTKFYTSMIFHNLRKKLFTLKRWEYGNDIICPILLEKAIDLSNPNKDQIFNFKELEFKFGIDCSNKSLDEIIIQIKTFLKILESAKFIVYNQRRELSKNYFNDYPLFVQNSLNVFDKYSISLYYTGIKNILSELNKLKELCTINSI